MSLSNYSAILLENSSTKLRYLSGEHVFQILGAAHSPSEALSNVIGSNYHTTVMVVNASGNVGVGTTAPVAHTHIYHPGAGDAFRVDNSVTTSLVVRTNGNVGVGVTNPDYKLYVDGDIYASGDLIAFSDARYKTEVEPVTDALSKLHAIHGYTYAKIGDESGKRHLGVLAQEVEAVIPEVVHTTADGYKSVAYGNLVGLLIEGIKELRARQAWAMLHPCDGPVSAHASIPLSSLHPADESGAFAHGGITNDGTRLRITTPGVYRVSCVQTGPGTMSWYLQTHDADGTETQRSSVRAGLDGVDVCMPANGSMSIMNGDAEGVSWGGARFSVVPLGLYG